MGLVAAQKGQERVRGQGAPCRRVAVRDTPRAGHRLQQERRKFSKEPTCRIGRSEVSLKLLLRSLRSFLAKLALPKQICLSCWISRQHPERRKAPQPHRLNERNSTNRHFFKTIVLTFQGKMDRFLNVTRRRPGPLLPCVPDVLVADGVRCPLVQPVQPQGPRGGGGGGFTFDGRLVVSYLFSGSGQLRGWDECTLGNKRPRQPTETTAALHYKRKLV